MSNVAVPSSAAGAALSPKADAAEAGPALALRSPRGLQEAGRAAGHLMSNVDKRGPGFGGAVLPDLTSWHHILVAPPPHRARPTARNGSNGTKWLQSKRAAAV